MGLLPRTAPTSGFCPDRDRQFPIYIISESRCPLCRFRSKFHFSRCHFIQFLRMNEGEGEGEEEVEKKTMKPLFPRLHVNDADKGGPRAPPRNKMALYEQLSLPSKRINSAAVAPSLLRACGNPAASAPANQGGGQERSMFSPFYIHQPPSQSAEMVHSSPSIASSLNSAGTELMRRSVRHTNPLSSALGLANVKSSHEKNLDNKDDIMISTFVRSDTVHSGKDWFMTETKRTSPLKANSQHKNHSATPNTSIQFRSSHDKPLEQKNTGRRSRIYDRNTTEHKCKEVIIKEQKEKDVNNLGSSSVQGHTGKREIIEKSHKKNTRVGLASNDSVPDPECLNANAENEDASLELNDGDKNEVSESSMLDSISDLGISPDDVVRVIGQKQFWKTRRAIVNQQRVFAIQVFELHRLIKVQKLLAASPFLLLEENLYASGSRQKVPSENTHTESIGKPDPQITKLNDDSQKPNQNTESQSEETTPAPPLPFHGDRPHLLPMYSPYSENPAPVPVAPGNHWLVPVMSPSEGLIYKPYLGPWPPPAGFMPPLNLSAVDVDNMIAPHQQNMPLLSGSSIPPTYFPSPSGLPANVSVTTVKQVGPSTGPIPRPHIGQRSRSSSKMDINEAHPASKDSELQGSTASSPFEKAQTLPLFPTAPAAEGSGRASESRVIKVVPHNPRSATESVARIIQSIQKERRQDESQ